MLLEGIQQVEIINQGIDWINVFITFLSVFLGALVAYLFSIRLNKKQLSREKECENLKMLLDDLILLFDGYNIYVFFLSKKFLNVVSKENSQNEIDLMELELWAEKEKVLYELLVFTSKLNILIYSKKFDDINKVVENYIFSMKSAIEEKYEITKNILLSPGNLGLEEVNKRYKLLFEENKLLKEYAELMRIINLKLSEFI